MTDQFNFPPADELGPKKIVMIQEPSIGLRGILVVDNTAPGPSIGGLRMALWTSTAISGCPLPGRM